MEEEENRNPTAPEGGADSILSAVYKEFGFANQMYGLVMQMKRELDGAGRETDGDAAAAARLVRMEHEAGQVLRRAVETEARLMAELNREPQASPPPKTPEPEQADASPAGADEDASSSGSEAEPDCQP